MHDGDVTLDAHHLPIYIYIVLLIDIVSAVALHSLQLITWSIPYGGPLNLNKFVRCFIIYNEAFSQVPADYFVS